VTRGSGDSALPAVFLSGGVLGAAAATWKMGCVTITSTVGGTCAHPM